jgi:hypothetical protein
MNLQHLYLAGRDLGYHDGVADGGGGALLAFLGLGASTKLQAREVLLCLLSKRFEIGDHIVNDMV